LKGLIILVCACAVSVGLSACAQFTPSVSAGIVPGTSAAKDVEAKMGQPAEKIAAANGDSVWFYPQNQAGRQTIAVRVSPDGIVRSVEERLEPEYIRKIVAGVTTTAQARELLGPPFRVARLPLQQRDVWEYLFYDQMAVKQILGLQFSPDGIVREINITRDPTEASAAK
jgi:hypothetical protein